MSRGAPRTKTGLRLFTDNEPMLEDILAVEAEMRDKTLFEVERAMKKRMHGGVWLGESQVLAIIAELRKEKP